MPKACINCNGMGCCICSYTGFEIDAKDDDLCPVCNEHCDEKKNTCEPDWNGNGEPAYCHLK